MIRSVILLRLSYWIAAMADFAIAILVWVPQRMGVSDTGYPSGLASAIAFSWGVMLLIADRKPLDRRWILLPTILVVALIAATRAVFSLQGSVEFSLPLLVFAISLLALMTYSYYYASRHASGNNTIPDSPGRRLQPDRTAGKAGETAANEKG